MVGKVLFNRSLLFGSGVLSRAAEQLPPGITKLALVGAPSFLNSPRGSEFAENLTTAGFVVQVHPIHGEPSPETVDPMAAALKAEKIQGLIAVGGGSVIDAAKAAAAMFYEEGSVQDFLEGVGTKAPSGQTLPVVAVPTTSGTGSEATKNAVISRPGKAKTSQSEVFGFKKSLRHDNYIPAAALLDPELLTSCPAAVTASCGMDAFSQLLESYLSTTANPVTDALAWDGLTRFLKVFPALMEDLENPELRLEVALGSYYSGITLANAGLGAVHGMAGAMGGLVDIPHGTACGTLVYTVFQATFDAWEGLDMLDDAAETARDKMGRLGSFLAGESLPAAEGCMRLLLELKEWERSYNLPRLEALGLTWEDLNAVAAGGNKNHPHPFTQEERLAILKERF